MIETTIAKIEHVESRPQGLLIKWAGGGENLYHYLWLRDNSPQSRTENGQRLIETSVIPEDITPISAILRDDNKIEIVWQQDRHISQFDARWLQEKAYPAQPRRSTRRFWDASLMDSLPEASYPDVTTRDDSLCSWLQAVHDYGFALLHDVPVVSEAVLDVVKLFGYVRETNYGRYFDVKTVANPNNLAYTSLPLTVHTDNPYRDPVPTLQLLHCLASDVDGGDSILVDGFCVAEALRRQSPDQFSLLSLQPVEFHFEDDDTDLRAEAPIITLNRRDEAVAIRFNNRSLAPFNFAPHLIEPYYTAYRAFAALLNNADYQVCFSMKPGDLFIVDNQRVLHGRTGFSSAGARHLQGCYADRDGLYSLLNVLKRKHSQ